jgi:hypothetical protein
MMLIASYIMYFSLEDAGERLGRDNEDYKASVRRYNEARNQISGDDIVALREFCLKYRENELDYRRTNALISKGYTKEEYEAYKRGELKSRRARRELMRVDKIRHSELSAADLLSCRVSKGDVDMRRPGMSKILSLIIRLIPSTVCTFFTVSVIISAKNDLTFSSVAESILKLATLPIIGLKGYSLGYEYAIGNELSWLNMKTELLCAFIKKREA